jgi:RNA polymerase sigma-70 factor (ECF subfamily)
LESLPSPGVIFLSEMRLASAVQPIGPEVLGRLVSEHLPALTLYARQWCDAPEDVVQDAFLKLATQRIMPDRPVAWLFTVVRNRAISVRRSAQRRTHHETAAAEQRRGWFVPSEGMGLDAAAAAAALRDLPLEQREAIIAHLWGGLTFEEIGPLLGCSTSSAHRAYAAGLEVLRERLGQRCPNEMPATLPVWNKDSET